MPEVHIVKENGTWKQKRNGRTVSTHRTQQTAINAARRNRRTGTHVYVHTPGGTIRQEFTVGGGDG